jgi:hypothetical protein
MGINGKLELVCAHKYGYYEQVMTQLACSEEKGATLIIRIKTFHILDGEEKLPMKDIAEQIFTICAYLVNLHSPIVKK